MRSVPNQRHPDYCQFGNGFAERQAVLRQTLFGHVLLSFFAGLKKFHFFFVFLDNGTKNTGNIASILLNLGLALSSQNLKPHRVTLEERRMHLIGRFTNTSYLLICISMISSTEGLKSKLMVV